MDNKADTEDSLQFPGSDEITRVLFDFLRKIAEENPAITAIRLVSARLGGKRSIQSILLETPDGVTERKVFGFAPFQARLGIKRDGNGCRLMPIA
jgi:hypothetical protein